jgi:TATA-binding protein-associated factor Taf7
LFRFANRSQLLNPTEQDAQDDEQLKEYEQSHEQTPRLRSCRRHLFRSSSGDRRKQQLEEGVVALVAIEERAQERPQDCRDVRLLGRSSY